MVCALHLMACSLSFETKTRRDSVSTMSIRARNVPSEPGGILNYPEAFCQRRKPVYAQMATDLVLADASQRCLHGNHPTPHGRPLIIAGISPTLAT